MSSRSSALETDNVTTNSDDSGALEETSPAAADCRHVGWLDGKMHEPGGRDGARFRNPPPLGKNALTRELTAKRIEGSKNLIIKVKFKGNSAFIGM